MFLQKLADIFPQVPLWIKILLLALPMLPNLWCIIQAGTRNFENPLERPLWLMAGMLVPVFGGLAFIIWGRKRVLPKARQTPADLN